MVELNKSNIGQLFQALNLSINLVHTEMVLLGIRGSKLNQYVDTAESLQVSSNDIVPDKWCCSIIQLGFNDNLCGFQATTLPGVFYEQNPMGAYGAARLLPGLWNFKRGLHKGNPALIQNEKMALLRDSDKDYEFDWDSDMFQVGFFGIDNHAGGGMAVGKWSAGCQVIKGDVSGGVSRSWESTAWSTYYKRATMANNSIYKYILIPENWLEKIYGDTPSQYVFYGSSGDMVMNIQAELGLKADGGYGEFTMREVMKWQKVHGIQPNGICGPQTLGAMGLV